MSVPAHEPSRLRAAAVTDVGPVRARNEDACLADLDLGLFVVADGVGGGPAGDVASQLAVDAVRDCLDGGCDGFGDIQQALTTAHHALRRAGRADADRAGMATTVVAAWVDMAAGTLTVGHVGDSRAYLCNDGRMRRLTDDHGVGSLLTQALGQREEPSPEVVEVLLSGHDLLLLCSDGVTDVLDDDALAALLASSSAAATDLDDLATAVVTAALDAGTRDNLTAVVADLSLS